MSKKVKIMLQQTETKFTVSTDGKEKERLLTFMRSYHVGKGSAAKKREILAHLYGSEAANNESYNNILDRKLRKMIEELINEGSPICSSAQCGYWYAANLNDGMESVTENKSRAMTQLANVTKLEKNILKEYGGQMGLL